jgi:hypothetical protein
MEGDPLNESSENLLSGFRGAHGHHRNLFHVVEPSRLG